MQNIKTKEQVAFGKAIKEFRAENKISQEELASEANLDRTYMSGIERGVRNPSLLNIAKIAKALHIKISELFKKVGL